MTFAIIEAAVRASMLEMYFEGEYQEKLCAVSFATLDLYDLLLEGGYMTADDDAPPDELNIYLKNVYAFLGDPLI